MSVVLEASNISITFGGLKAVSNFSIKLHEGELVGLIGPNGAGKTTVFNMLTGIYTPSSGKIYICCSNEQMIDITSFKPHKITQAGIARTFQNIRLFKDLSVLDNVRIAFHSSVKYSALGGIIRSRKYVEEEERILAKSKNILSIFNLLNKQNELAKNLPYGEQRKLEIVRALAANPKLLLLDEPAAGMNPQETHELMNLIAYIRKEFNLTILLIEHDMSLVMGICERIVVLDYGQIIAEGTPSQISSNPKVIKAYLGGGDE